MTTITSEEYGKDTLWGNYMTNSRCYLHNSGEIIGCLDDVTRLLQIADYGNYRTLSRRW